MTLPTNPVIPDDSDPIEDLTVVELSTVGTAIDTDPAIAAADPTSGLRWLALAHIGHAWHKRLDPEADVNDWLAATPRDLMRLLPWQRPTPSQEEDSEDPTDSTPG